MLFNGRLSTITLYRALTDVSLTPASVLLSAYGYNVLALDRLQNYHPNELKEASGGMGELSHGKRGAEPPPPIPIGVHPISYGRTEIFPMEKRSGKPGLRRR